MNSKKNIEEIIKNDLDKNIIELLNGLKYIKNFLYKYEYFDIFVYLEESIA